MNNKPKFHSKRRPYKTHGTLDSLNNQLIVFAKNTYDTRDEGLIRSVIVPFLESIQRCRIVFTFNWT